VDLYLVRHGDAVSAAENPARPLSLEGRRRVELTASLALERDIRISRIYHSGILRAQQTAEVLAARFGAVEAIAPLSGLLPEDDPAIVAAELDAHTASTLLVGHLPFLSRLAALLVNGDPERPVVEFFPATMVCCSRLNARWEVNWRIAP
jgi:phosphohistidine phosphatase